MPCALVRGKLQQVEISAPGHKPARVMLPADSTSHLEVWLEQVKPATPVYEKKIGAAELSESTNEKIASLRGKLKKSLARKDYNRAGELLMEALQLSPSSVWIFNNLAVVALHRNDLDSAGSWLQKADELAPFNPDILGNLALVRWMQNRLDESYELLVKALSRGYKSNSAHYILGTLSLRKGQAKEAVYHLERSSSDLFPYRDLYLSIALRILGKSNPAAKRYSDYLRRHPVEFIPTSPQR